MVAADLRAAGAFNRNAASSVSLPTEGPNGPFSQFPAKQVTLVLPWRRRTILKS